MPVLKYDRLTPSRRGRGKSHRARTNAVGNTKHTRESRRYRSCGEGAPLTMRRKPPYHSLQCLHFPPDASFIAHLSHASRQPQGTASKVTGLPHLHAVTWACSDLTTAVAMPPPPAQQMHHPQEPSCNSYGSSTGLPPTSAATRGGHDRRCWAALRVRTPSIGAWPVGQVLDQGERRRVFLCLAKGRGVLSGFLDENSAHPSRRENTDFSRAPRSAVGNPPSATPTRRRTRLISNNNFWNDEDTAITKSRRRSTRELCFGHFSPDLGSASHAADAATNIQAARQQLGLRRRRRADDGRLRRYVHRNSHRHARRRLFVSGARPLHPAERGARADAGLARAQPALAALAPAGEHAQPPRPRRADYRRLCRDSEDAQTKNHPLAGPGDDRRRAGGQRLNPSHTTTPAHESYRS